MVITSRFWRSALLALACSVASAHANAAAPTWVQAFAINPAEYAGDEPPPQEEPAASAYARDRTPLRGTQRYRFAVSLDGTRLQVRLSNELGSAPLVVQGASIGRAAAGMDVLPDSVRRLTFGGREAVTIVPGAPVLSDPVDLAVKANEDLVTSVFIPEERAAAPRSGATLWQQADDAVMTPHLAAPQIVHGRPVVTGVYVQRKDPAAVIVAFGDSITDGARFAPEQPHGWVDPLSRALARRRLAVISSGIGGGRMLRDGWGPSALSRADRDVFAVPGVRSVILLEGINDIGMARNVANGSALPLDLDALLKSYAQIAARAHARGLKIYGGTLTPIEGSSYFSAENEDLRQQVNHFIRTSGVFDGVIDFDRAAQDPSHPARFKPEYDSGDHLHPGEVGYAAMARAAAQVLVHER